MSMPVPLQFTIPGLHETGEVLKLPLRKSGVDQSGLFDYSDSDAKAARVPHVLTGAGTPAAPVPTSDGLPFNGAQYATIPHSADHILGSGDFCIEIDLRADAPGYGIASVPLFKGNTVGSVCSLLTFMPSGTYTLICRFGLNAGAWLTNELTIGTLTQGVFNHVVIKRTGTLFETFLDGVAGSSQYAAGTVYELSEPIWLGYGNYSTTPFEGIIRNFRWLKGTSTVPTNPMILPQDLFQYNPHEVLNLPFTGHTTDLSFGTAKAAPETAHVLTAVGSPTVDATGVTFDASPEYYSIPGSADWGLGTADYYIRLKVRLDNIALVQGFLDNMTGANDNGFHLRYHGGVKRLDWTTALGNHDHYASWNPSLGMTYEIEVIKSSNTVTMKVDGTTIYGPVADTGTWGDATHAMYIGREAGRNNDSQLYGTLSDLIILKGASVAPTSPMVLPQDLFQYNPHEIVNLPFIGNTTDLSFGTAKAALETAHSVTLYGNASVASGVLSLPAGTDIAEVGIARHVDFQNWTAVVIEWEVLLGAGSGTAYRYMLSADQYGGANKFFDLFWQMGGDIFRYRDSALGTRNFSFAGLNNGEWRKLTLVIQQGVNPKIYVDGVEVSGSGDATASAGCNFGLLIGGLYNGGSGGSLAYSVRNLKIAKGTVNVDVFPATYKHALQELRLAQGGVELPYTAPLRGLNPVSGQCDLWATPTETDLEVYIGNAAADTPTAGVTWPTEWKRVFHRSGFAKDLVNSGLLTPSGAVYTDKDGAHFVAATSDFYSDADSDDFPVNTEEWSIVFELTPRAIDSSGEWHYLCGQLNGGDYWLVGWRYGFGNGYFVQTSSNGVLGYRAAAYTLDTLTNIAFIRRGNAVELYINGAYALDISNSAFTLGNVAGPLTIAQIGGQCTTVDIASMSIIKGLALSSAQVALLSSALHTPATFNTVGTLEPNV